MALPENIRVSAQRYLHADVSGIEHWGRVQAASCLPGKLCKTIIIYTFQSAQAYLEQCQRLPTPSICVLLAHFVIETAVRIDLKSTYLVKFAVFAISADFGGRKRRQQFDFGSIFEICERIYLIA